ncbi:hypothetical protein AZE42_09328 [Rhizopogon vesiculosus]|uniref:Uncharacterized protein n=1 Tax=Rhizopogon vesiculosus TaxID=180088 RepID=A0A1J8QHK3_9AGAM|nr:hypothetical protein AZE42_09328 [Rhizopogon vesiculosus]
MTRQPTQESDYRRGPNPHVPKIDGADRQVAGDLQDVKQGGQAKFDTMETFTPASKAVNIKTGIRYLARIRSFYAVTFGKPDLLSASIYAPPSYILLSDMLDTITNTRSLISLATSDSDDTVHTVNDTIRVSSLLPLASEAFREELYIRGYLKRPDHENRFLRWLRRTFLRWLRYTFVPWVLRVVHNYRPKQVTVVDSAASRYPRHPSPKALGRRGGLAVVDALKVQSGKVEGDPRTPTPPTTSNSSAPRSIKESPLSASLSNSATIEDPLILGTPTRLSFSDRSIYWSCQSPPTTPDSSVSPSVQESRLSASSSGDLREFSYATSYTTPPSSPELADLEKNDVLGKLGMMSSISETALRSLAPRVTMMNVKRPRVELDARSFPRLWYAEVCHHRLV